MNLKMKLRSNKINEIKRRKKRNLPQVVVVEAKVTSIDRVSKRERETTSRGRGGTLKLKAILEAKFLKRFSTSILAQIKRKMRVTEPRARAGQK
jgi:hypothetical protein